MIKPKQPMYKDISPEMLSLIEPVAEAHGLEIVDVSVKRGPGSQVRIVVDTPAGDGRVTIDACAAVSREVGHGLDAGELLPGAYLLEVCSPGIDRVLGRTIDFERAVGRRVALETRESLSGRRRFRGELLSFRGEQACLRADEQEFQIPFAAIAKAKAFHPQDSPGAKR